MQDLQTKTHDELRTIAKQLGIKTGNAGEKVLRAKIVAVLYPAELDAAAASGVERVEPEKRGHVTVYYTEPAALEAEMQKRHPKLKLTIDDSTWCIQNGVAEDSGPLAMPIGVILRKAGELATARLPAKFKGTGSELDGALA